MIERRDASFGKSMPGRIESIRNSMFGRADPVIFRSVAYVAAVAVAATDQLLGGKWWAIPAAIVLVAGTSYILPAERPEGKVRNRILAALQTIRCWSWRVRLACAALMVVGVAAMDFYAGGFNLGRNFNVNLIPVFLSSLLFGLPLAIATWLFSFLAVYYWVIPPTNSFAIGSLKDFAELIGYFYMGLFALAIPVLIRASSVAEEPG